MINFKGQEVTLYDLSMRYGIAWSTLNNRHKAGLCDDELVTKGKLRAIVHFGKKSTLTQISKDTGIAISTLKNRHANGLRDKELINIKHGGVGNKQSATKLTENDVIEIKMLLITSKLNQKEIAAIFDADPSHISDIKRGKRWGDVVVNYDEIIN
ncbi:hypothetical protein [Moritella sp. F3]|uniref:hypothetical protein n=1 Tax=Moritella sp. F3 TaxID=2718882 RepID=UPI0018E16EC8|nr:hypothetical protein [Moritella sp. F3]GIC77664.1 hypothetical protein FMO001_23910 [Moritella sp. F1]GIC82077.1 hypothetical protein FMO003_23580 [Moritella sp. F3]